MPLTRRRPHIEKRSTAHVELFTPYHGLEIAPTSRLSLRQMTFASCSHECYTKRHCISECESFQEIEMQ